MIWQPRHHVLSRLARYFHVVWMNPPHEWRDLPRRRYNAVADVARPPDIPGFSVYTPEAWLPKSYRPSWLVKRTIEERLSRGRRLLTSRGCKKIILYLSRPDFEPELRMGLFDLSCYHIDDEFSFSEVELPLDETEVRVIRSVDQVFLHSPGLLERKGSLNPHSEFIPNGVDYLAYSTPLSEPADLAPIPRPRIGYTGYIKSQLDWALIDQLTQRHSKWSFVFVGPHSAYLDRPDLVQRVFRYPNVHFLGAKSFQDLAAYPQHFDVCIMPYKANFYTQYIYPLKLHEYLASGRPTVGTRIRSLEDLADWVTLASDIDEWSGAIAAGLAPSANSPSSRAARQTVAQRHDWEILVAKIAKILAGRIGPEYLARLAPWLDGCFETWLREAAENSQEALHPPAGVLSSTDSQTALGF
jgi:glycosyltransferase involved in cell wall biosynthesis